jgi:hypothetical protein
MSALCQQAAAYSITSSARPSNVTGMVTPSAFADLRIENQLDLGGLLDWQVRRLLALENAPSVGAGKVVCIHNIACVAGQAACGRELVEPENRGHRMPKSQFAQLGLGVDHQLELGRLLNWKIGRFRALYRAARPIAY